MFVSWKVIFGKPLSKLSCVCLPLEKVVNGKHFPVKEKHFPVNGKHFSVKEKFNLVFRKMFFLLTVFVFRKVISGKTLSKLSCVCLPLEKLINGKHFPVKEKFGLVFRKVFCLENLGEKHFLEVVKNLEMSLFADYIKFDPQTFDCYIYILF